MKLCMKGSENVNDLSYGLQRAIDYIDENLCDELEISKIAARAYLSQFYFQRVFNAVCGMTVGEYIRNRRLSLAGEELSRSSIKVIDIALKYGYDSPDSFSRAFTKFHGISPLICEKKWCKNQEFCTDYDKL